MIYQLANWLQLGMFIIGTLGIILRAKHEGLIEAVWPLIDLMTQTNFRVSDELYQTVIRQAGQE